MRKKLLSLLLAICMVTAALPVSALGADEETAETYSITVKANAGGETKVVSIGGEAIPEEAESTSLEAAAGTSIAFSVTADENNSAVSVGYWEIKDGDTWGPLVSLTASEDGTYTFEMPSYPVGVGASFEDSTNSPTKSGTEAKDDEWTLYTALQDAWLHPSDDSVSARIILDERFLEDNSDMELIVELRQYGTGGYTLVGSKTYHYSELSSLCGAESENVSMDNGLITIDNVIASLNGEETFEEGKAVYTYIKIGRPSWIDARGERLYRNAYSGDATVLADGADEPAPIVWLYHLDANTYRGSVIHGILEALQIPFGTIDSNKLGQNIGYLVNWDGYESVDDPYCDESFDVEYILMGNLVETDLDDFLDAMVEANIRVNLKSVPTAWTASKTFVELFSIMASEDAAFKALIALDSMIYDAENIVEDAAYTSNENYGAFLVAYHAAVAAIGGEEELEAEEYEALTEDLLNCYLLVTGKTLLAGRLALILTKNEDGAYTVSAQLNDGPENAAFTYEWQDGDHDSTISAAESELYKVRLTIAGTGSFYGEVTAKFSVPHYEGAAVTAGKTAITVNFTAPDEVINTPPVTQYIAALYKENGELIDTLTAAGAGQAAFTGLAANTSYTLKTYLVNVVGRSNIIEENITTLSAGGSEGNSSGSAARTISVSGASNGAVTVDRTSAGRGATVTLTVSPNSGYALDSLTVTDADGNSVSLTKVSDTKYTFVMPALKVTVKAAFEESAPVNTGSFHDVDTGDYYFDAAEWAVEKGITTGTGAATFSPDALCTRAQVVTFLWRAAGSPAPASTVNPFADVSSGAYYYDAVLWAVEKGITAGISETAFGPDAAATRGQTVTFLYRDAGSPAVSGSEAFSDVSNSDYCADAVQWSANSGITNGTGAATFAPESSCTRAQIVTLLYRYLAG